KRILHSIPSLVIYILKNKPEVIYTALSHVNFISIIAKKLAVSKVKIITSTRSLDSANPKGKLNKLIQSYVLKHSYKHIAITNTVKKLIMENKNFSEDNIYVINNPILKKFETKKRNKKNENDSKDIITVGRLEPVKNHLLLIKAFKKVIKENNNVHLTIVGDGSFKKKLVTEVEKEKIEKYITFTGFQSQTSKFYENADLFVLPSIKEGLGNVVVEAMSYSLPIIVAKNSGGPVEILKDNISDEDNFFIQHDCEDLANKILKNLSSKNKVEYKDLNKYTVSQISKKYLELIYD